MSRSDAQDHNSNIFFAYVAFKLKNIIINIFQSKKFLINSEKNHP